MLYKAVKEHEQNFDIFSGIQTIESRDDIEPTTKKNCDEFSIHRRLQNIIDSTTEHFIHQGGIFFEEKLFDEMKV